MCVMNTLSYHCKITEKLSKFYRIGSLTLLLRLFLIPLSTTAASGSKNLIKTFCNPLTKNITCSNMFQTFFDVIHKLFSLLFKLILNLNFISISRNV